MPPLAQRLAAVPEVPVVDLERGEFRGAQDLSRLRTFWRSVKGEAPIAPVSGGAVGLSRISVRKLGPFGGPCAAETQEMPSLSEYCGIFQRAGTYHIANWPAQGDSFDVEFQCRSPVGLPASFARVDWKFTWVDFSRWAWVCRSDFARAGPAGIARIRLDDLPTDPSTGTGIGFLVGRLVRGWPAPRAELARTGQSAESPIARVWYARAAPEGRRCP